MAFDLAAFQRAMGIGSDPGLLSQVPKWNVNDPNSAQQIKDYTSGANAGIDLSGANAFLRAGPTKIYTPGEDGGYSWDPQSLAGYRELGKSLGLDMGDESIMGVEANMAKMNEALKDYRFISGLQPGQDGLKTYETIYQQDADGNLNPVSARQWQRPENHGFLRSESGGSLLAAAAVAAPALAGVFAPAAMGASGAGAGAGAAAGEGITGLSTSGLYGSGTLGGGYLSGTGMLGSGLTGATGSTLAGSGMAGWAGGLGAGITGAMVPGAYGASAGSSFVDKIVDKLRNQVIKKGTNKLLGEVLGGGQRSGGRSGVGGSGVGMGSGGVPQVRSGYAASEALANALLNKEKTPYELAQGEGKGEGTANLLRALRQASAGSGGLV